MELVGAGRRRKRPVSRAGKIRGMASPMSSPIEDVILFQLAALP
ncbi:MAG: hypothetical protein JWP92_2429, partial [Caulobacter sp.]|nr:hypothetical protein [Caulobacter sp.]